MGVEEGVSGDDEVEDAAECPDVDGFAVGVAAEE